MNKPIKFISMLSILFLFVVLTALPVSAASRSKESLSLTDNEQAFVAQTQNEKPLSVGIIPHAFPLSECPPESSDFVGINVEMLDLISELSGLKFEYVRIPLEDMSPFQMLQSDEVSMVAGSIKLDEYLTSSSLLLSDRLCDGSATCIVRTGSTASLSFGGKVAVMRGYQAGLTFAKELFSNYEVELYNDNRSVMRAVREGNASLAIISRYVGVYELQNPMNEMLTELTMLEMEKDSCAMAKNTPEMQTAISIINKAIAAIGQDGYNNVQMNFSLNNPYKLTYLELLYKYKNVLIVVLFALVVFCILCVRLLFAQKVHNRLLLDPLTGAYTEAGFALAAAKILPKISAPLFITDFDIFRFSSYNEVNGKEQGDKLLQSIVTIVRSHLCEQDVICRTYADHFKVLSSKNNINELIEDIHTALESFSDAAQSSIVLNFGIYPVTDKAVPIAKMLDFAGMAKKHIKNDQNTFIGVFDETLLARYINEAKMSSSFKSAIKNKEFVPYYQPKFDAAKKNIIGAEALVRWITEDGTIIPPIQFIELFEKSGQIQELDFYMLEQVCDFINGLIAKNLPVLPIAVNFSRVHLYSNNFIEKIKQIVEQSGIPKNLIEIECTETTMLNNIETTRKILGDLQALGFVIAMDDFGSAYSSLNTLCSIPLDVLKLDGGFLAATLSHEKAKADIIIRSVMGLAHDLFLKVVAEGVETEEQYEFLKSLGCDFIQGYYFSRPLDEAHFLELLSKENPADIST